MTDSNAGAARTVLTFDDIALSGGSEARIGNGYGGFTWIEAGVYSPDGGLPGYVAASGANLAFIAEANSNEVGGYEDSFAGTPFIVIRDTPFALDSAAFVAAFRDGLTITVRAYADVDANVLIGTKTFSASFGVPQVQDFTSGVDGTFFGATRLEFSANDGDSSTNDYFGIDDLTFTNLRPVTLDFEESTLGGGAESRLLSSQGFQFGQTGVYAPDGSIPGYAAGSGNNIGFIAEANGKDVPGYEDAAPGAPVVITNADAFAFLGGGFSAAFRDGLTVTVRGYADADGTQLVAETAITFDRGSIQSFDVSGFAGLHRLEFVSDDGDANTNDYFGFDDLRFLVPGVEAPLLG